MKNEVICARCEEIVQNVFITPFQLKKIIHFAKLCEDCDTKIRKKNIQKIEMQFKKYQRK